MWFLSNSRNHTTSTLYLKLGLAMFYVATDRNLAATKNSRIIDIRQRVTLA